MAMKTKDIRLSADLGAPGEDVAAVTPNDATDLPDGPARFFYVGVAGDVTLITQSGNTVLFKAHPIGYLYCRAIRVKSTGTSADNILAIM